MLKEIYCDKFIEKGTVRPPIVFKDGLNLITGETLSGKDSGNSLGKSTFLLIIDFVFGGKSYCEKSKAPSLVGHHDIYFTFEFNNIPYYFCRKTSDKTKVYKCDKNRNIIESISIEEYTLFLAEKYNIDTTDISFREYISPFFRIYKKSPNAPNEPLKSFSSEGTMEQIRNFEKIFNIYADIKNEAQIVDTKKATDDVKKYSQKKKVELEEFEKISFKDIQNEIQTLNEKKDELQKKQKSAILELDSQTLDKIVAVKNGIRKLKKDITILMIKIAATHENIASSPLTKESFELLLQFFPDANIKKLEEIENFHKTIGNILAEESQNAENKLQAKLDNLQKELHTKQDELYNLSGRQELSDAYIQELVTLQTQLDKKMGLLKKEENKKELKEKFSKATGILKDKEFVLISQVQKRINTELAILSELILGKNYAPIELAVKPGKSNSFSYTVSSKIDDGTSTDYLSSLTFDLVALKLTLLPAFCHDSYCLSDTNGYRLAALLECYEKVIGRQLFVALHKNKDFEPSVNKILQEKTVLPLFENGGELFGYSFATIKK